MLCGLFSPVAEATDGGLKCFLGINVNVSGLEGPACWLSMTRKEVGCPHDCYTLVATSVLKIPFWWDWVGIDFSGRVPGYSRQWAIIGDSTKISTFTNLKHTQIMGSNHLLYFSSATFFAFKTVRHRRNVNQEKISVHSKHGCGHKRGVT